MWKLSCTLLVILCVLGVLPSFSNAADCNAGQYAVDNTTCAFCEPGYYCMDGVTRSACPAGKYNGATGSSSVEACKDCASGFYTVSTGSASCTECPIGMICPFADQSPDGDACTDGRYTPAAGQTECTNCPAGHYCPDADQSPVKCPKGQYRPSDGAHPDCLSCGTGTYTPASGATECTPCPAGSKCDGTDKVSCAVDEYADSASSSSCTSCPAGKSCSSSSASPTTCPKGTYSGTGDVDCLTCPNGEYQDQDGQSSCNTCPSGYECSDPSVSPVRCAAGTYSNSAGTACLVCGSGKYSSAGASSCTDCPAGSYCNDVASTPQLCAKGYISGSTQTSCDACAAGTYSNAARTSCIPCDLGFECSDPTAGPVACTPGTYADTQGSTACNSCPAGKFCSDPTLSPQDCTTGYSTGGAVECSPCPYNQDCSDSTSSPSSCPSGEYSPEGDSSCVPCPAGYQCQPTYQACPTGYYSQEGSAYCTICPAGYSCSNDNPPAACDAGTFSLEGVMSCSMCPAGYSCSSSEHVPQLCPDGYYSVGGQVTSCTACSQGYYCPDKTVASEVPCPDGSYSNAGQKSCTMCPAGEACPTVVGYSPQPCNAGFYSTGGLSECTECPAGSYCPDADQLPLRCPAGYYSSDGASQCTICPAGSSCVDPSQTPQQCGVGTYALAGSISCKVCSGGVVCGLGATSPLDGTICPEGAYCPPGTAQPVECPVGTYGTSEGQSELQDACTSCPAGKICEAGSTSVSLSDCDPGYYCPTGTRFSDEFPCPAGTYNPNTDSSSINDCLNCPAGFYCDAGATSGTTNQCPTGHYCPPGTTHPRANPCPPGTYNSNLQADSVDDCIDCPEGAFCGLGSSNPSQCPRGTFNNVTAATNAQYCRACPAGYACTQVGMTNPYQFKCSPGHYCPQGTAGQQDHPCPAGTYTDHDDLISIEECELCLEGTACEPGTGGGVKTPVTCAQGYYCPGVATLDPPTYFGDINTAGNAPTYYAIPGLATGESQMPCPAGTYGTFSGATHRDNCTSCPPGKYCVKAATIITGDCDPGYYCPEGSSLSFANPCPAGTYSSRNDLSDETQCEPCPAGSYCLEHATEPTKCPSGSYNPYQNITGRGPSVDGSGKCIICPAGYKCPTEGDVTPTPCGEGFYSVDGETSCRVCPSGYYCPDTNTSKSVMESDYVCPSGSYCPEGTISPESGDNITCPVRHYCPSGTKNPVPCPVGTYNFETGLKAASECSVCEPGYYCLEGSYNATTKCDRGFYCPAGSSGPQERPCPAGRYADFYGAVAADTCEVCPSGRHCPPGTADPIECPRGYYCPCGVGYPEPCPIGTFGNETGLTSIESCKKCLPGQYCDSVGGVYPTGPCDAGYYCSEGAYTSQPSGPPTGGLCPRGGYCIVGSKEPEPCLPGTFNNFTGGKSTDDCVPCTPGYYCFGSNNPSPTGFCDAGYFCNGSASVATQYEAPAGTYTFAGASSPIPCPQGSYNPFTVQSNCTLCEAGFYCPALGLTEKTTCPEGSYCPEGSVVPTPCPPGTFSNQPNLKESSQCLDCPAGKYCDRSGLTEPAGDCAKGHYCTGGTTRSNPVTSPGDDQNGDLCDPGRYCPNGTTNADAYRCPPGTYSESRGNRDVTQCLDCSAGFYCPDSGTVTPTNECTAGYYCIQGAVVASPVDGETGDICPNGTYCPQGSQQPKTCLPGTYQNLAGQSSCYNCPEGYFCDSSTGTVNPELCPAGYYCPNGTDIPVACPPGTFSTSEGVASSSECSPCPGGKYCATSGLQAPTGDCDAGYFCIQGARYATGTVDGSLGSEGGMCQAGNYCPQGSNIQKQCPPGTYSPSTQNTNSTQCLDCSPGYYCEVAGLSEPEGKCDAGYYCTGGAASPTPDDGSSRCFEDSGGPCPPGKYCPEGSFAPIPCSAGEYQDSPAQVTCKTCPAGFFCNDTVEGTASPVPCLQGHYCPEGSGIFLEECRPGTFSNKRGLSNFTECTPCSGGKVCSVSGLTEPDDVCLQGYYCTSGAKTETGTPGALGGSGDLCPAGSYCPTGSSSPQQCPSGTYSPSTGNTNVTSCIECTPGFYCSVGGLTEPNGVCRSGCYCSGGASSNCPTNSDNGGACPVGHYCPEESVAPVPCAPGYFSSVVGRSTCEECPAGSVCSGTTSVPFDCPQGRYCPGGIGTIIPQCPLGTFSNKTALDSEEQCSLCSGGSFCGSQGLFEPEGLCAEGYYCTRGAVDNVGTLGEYGGGSGVCPIGHYCPEGSTIATPCPQGTFSSITNLGKESDCTPCTAGKFCGTPALSTPTGACSEGYYCPPGQTTATPSSYLCPKGYHCPEGSVLPQGCAFGTYQPEQGKATCIECPEGNYCKNNATSPITCPVSYYCPKGTGNPLPCSNGTYSTVSGIGSLDQCIPCPPGKWCAMGSVIGDCSAGYQCRLGSDTPSPDFLPGENSKGNLCPRGFYCPVGTVTPSQCPVGLFSSEIGASDSSVCGPCGAGFVCYDGTSEKIPCPVGQYCPQDGGVTDCPKGTYNPEEGGKNSSACLPCEAGYTCPETGLQSYINHPCPIRHFCKSGSAEPTPCPAGTYRALQRGMSVDSCSICPAGHYCEEASFAPKECISTTSNASYCPEGSSAPVTCPAGYYCGFRTSTPMDCPSGYYCPVNTFQPTPCPIGHYCPENSIEPTQCPFGYKRRNETTLRETLEDACELCPAGTYGNHPQRESCAECQTGYYCEEGATHGRELSSISRNVYACPQGHYCTAGSSEPEACPKGKYQDKTGQAGCELCQAGQQNPIPGASQCQICGPSSFSDEGAATCTCTGAFRVYQSSDKMCVCRPGYIFYNEDLSVGDDTDGTSDCQPFIYNRCNTGSKTARDLVGNCIPESPSSCTEFCRYHGGTGTINSELGVCECSAIVNEDEVCDSTCRNNQLQMRINTRRSKLEFVDPGTTSVVSDYNFQAFTTGTVDCVQSECEVKTVQSTSQGFVGLYDPPTSYYENILNSTQLSTIPTTDSRSIVTRNTFTQQDGILQPVVCLPYGSALNWDISHPSREHYPVYMKDALLNTVPDFDYGPFRRLDEWMRSNLTMTTFVYTFQQPGVYVFHDHSSTDRVMIVRVMDENEQCPSTATFKPITRSNLVSLGIKRRDSMLLAPDWLLVVVLLIAFLLFIAILIAGIHYFRTRTWKGSKSGKAAFRKMLPLSDIESKGIGFAQRQLFASKQKIDEEAVEDDPNIIDLEGFSIKLFYEKLQDQKDRVKDDLDNYQNEFLEKYNKILGETKEIRNLLSNGGGPALSVDVNSMVDGLSDAPSKEKAEKTITKLKEQVEKLNEDQKKKKPFDPKDSSLDPQDVKRAYNLDLEEDQNRKATINQYNLLISRLEDRLSDLQSTNDESEAQSILDNFNKTLETSKMIIGKSLEKMNSNISERDALQKKSDDPFGKFNLSDDMAQALKEFLSSQMQNLFEKYTNLGAEENEEDEQGEEEEEDGEEEDDESEDNMDEDELQALLNPSDSEEDDEELHESKEENEPEPATLQKEQKKRKVFIKHKHKAQIQEIVDDVDESEKREKGIIVEKLDEHAQRSLNEMKDRLNMVVKNKNIGSDERVAIMEKGRKDMEDYKAKIHREKSHQSDLLRDTLKKKTIKKLRAAKEVQEKEKEDNKKDDQADEEELQKFISSIENDKERFGEGVEAQTKKQKEILKHKLQMRKKKRERQQARDKENLKNMLDKQDEIDRSFEEDTIDKTHKRLISLKKDELEKAVKNHVGPDREKQEMMETFQKDLQKYKSDLNNKKQKQMEDLENSLRSRRTEKEQELEKEHAVQEREDIEAQEKDLNELRKIMAQHSDSNASHGNAVNDQRRKQAETLQRKLALMAKKRAKKEKQFNDEEKKVEEGFKSEEAKETEKAEKEAEEQFKQEQEKLDKQLEEDLKKCDSEDEKKHLMRLHKEESDNLKSSMDRQKKEQMSALQKKLAEKRQAMQKKLQDKKKQAFKEELEKQEKVLNESDAQVEIDESKANEQPVEIDKEDSQEEEQMKKTHEEELKNLEENLEEQAEKEIQALEKESMTDAEKLKAEKDIKKRLLTEKSELLSKRAGDNDDEKKRIMSELNSNLQNLEKQYSNEEQKQKQMLRERLAQRRKDLSQKKKDKLNQEKKNFAEQERENKKEHTMKAEKRAISNILSDEAGQLDSVTDAIDRVIVPRQKRESQDLLKRQELELANAKPDEVEDLKVQHLDERVKLKADHVSQRKELTDNFQEHEKLLQSTSQQNDEVDEDLKKFSEQLEAQKRSNMEKIAKQKEEVKKKMQKELDEMKRKVEEEKSRMQKELQDEKNKLSVQSLIKEQEDQMQEMFKKQKDIEEDERTQLLAQHKVHMDAFEKALEVERKRQGEILKKRIDEIMDRKMKQQEEEANHRVDEEFEKGIKSSKKDQDKEEAKDAIRVAQSTASLMNLVSRRGKEPPKNGKTAHKVAPKPSEPKLTEEQAWLGPIYQKLKDIEALLLSEKRPFIDSRDQHIRNEGRLEQVSESTLSVKDIVYYKFGQFVVRLLRSKFSFLPETKLLIAKSLPITQYNHNAFKNSFFYDRAKNTLFIRDSRLNNVGKLIVLVVHCMAHIGIKDMSNDENPLFTKYFYTMLEVVCEDMFLSRQPNAEIIESKKASVLNEISKMCAHPGSSTPTGLGPATSSGRPTIARQSTKSMMQMVSEKSGAPDANKNMQLRKLAVEFRKIKGEMRKEKDEAKKDALMKRMTEVRSQMDELKK